MLVGSNLQEVLDSILRMFGGNTERASRPIFSLQESTIALYELSNGELTLVRFVYLKKYLKQLSY